MKKINFKGRKLRIFIPFLLIASVAVSAGGFLFSPMGQQIIRPQSLVAGYDQLNKTVIHENKYRPDPLQKQLESNLKIISKPNLDQTQSLDFKNNSDYKKNADLNDLSFPITSINSATSAQPTNHTVWSVTMNKEQFSTFFLRKRNPDIGFKFDLKFSAFNSKTNKDESKVYSNLITGYSLSDLLTLKSRSYLVFNHTINDDFNFLLGRITANLETSMDRIGNYTIKFVVSSYGITSNQISTDAAKNQFKIDFNPNSQAKVLFAVWDLNGENDLSQYFWPKPKGPEQNSKIVLPKQRAVTVGLNQYQVKKKSYPNINDANFDLAASQVENVSSNQGTNTTVSDVYVINMSQAQWQQELYSQYSNQPTNQPTNPGLMVQFNLALKLNEAEYGASQPYDTTLYGFFHMSDLLNGKEFNQIITDYDLNSGRSNNIGKVQLNMNVKVALDRRLTISLSVVGDNLGYIPSTTLAQPLTEEQKNVRFDLNNLSLVSYYDTAVEAVKPGDVGPNTDFTQDVSASNYQAGLQNISVRNEYTNDSGRGKKWNRGFWGADPYLYLYNTVWSSQGSYNIKPFVEDNQNYANNSKLTFNFGSLPQYDNKMRIVNKIPNGIEQYVSFNAGWNQSSTNAYPESKIWGTNLTDSQDKGNNFQIYVNQLTTSPKEYNWKTMYTYLQGGRQWMSQWEPTLAYVDNWQFQASLMRMRFYIQLSKSADNFTINYKIGVSAASYQWFWTESVAAPAEGKGGFKLNSIDLNVKV